MGTWVCGFVGPDGAQWRTDANREVPHTHGPTHPVSRECRAPGSGGCRPGVRRFSFEARGAVAQLGERLDRTQEVRGSSPLSSILTAISRQLSAISVNPMPEVSVARGRV